MLSKLKSLGRGGLTSGGGLGGGFTKEAEAEEGFVSTTSLAFDGSNEFCSRANSNTHNFGAAMSISMWLKASGGESGVYRGIVVKSDAGAGVGAVSYIFASNGANAGKLYLVLYGDGGTTRKDRETSVTVFDDTWHHFVMTWGSSTIKCYVDGVEDASLSSPINDSFSSLNIGSTGLRFGSQLSSGTPGNFYNGRLNNVSLWSIALNQTQIDDLSSNGKPADLSLHSAFANCRGWWKCGDGDTIGANGILDSTSNALHLSPTNMEAADIVTDAP